jgi:hypothetical protein
MNQNTNKTHCVRGHEFIPENTYKFESSGNRRLCRQCALDRSKNTTKEQRDRRNKQKKEARKSITKIQKRELNLKQIGWTLERFEKELKKQKSKCAICKKKLTFEDRITGSRACADHIHSVPPKPRGILCANCNLGIGNLKENCRIMKAAIAYVEKYQEG